MKALKTIMLVLFVTTLMSAQDQKSSDIPEVVKNSFTKEYAKAMDVEWEKDRDNYKVEFDIGQMDHTIWYTNSGKIIRKEQDITEKDLPSAVWNEIDANYSEYIIDDVKMIWENNTTTYKVEFDEGEESWDVIFDSQGKVLEESMD